MNGVVAAVDLGATSGRVMLGRVGANELELHAVARFSNTPVTGMSSVPPSAKVNVSVRSLSTTFPFTACRCTAKCAPEYGATKAAMKSRIAALPVTGMIGML